jgi:hypothetical protein
MWVVLSIIGWVGFAGVLVLYLVGNRINARDENALALYALCLMFEDNFRVGNTDGFRRFIEEQAGEKPTDVTFWVVKAIKKTAIAHAQPVAEPISTFTLAEHCVGKHLPAAT